MSELQFMYQCMDLMQHNYFEKSETKILSQSPQTLEKALLHVTATHSLLTFIYTVKVFLLGL